MGTPKVKATSILSVARVREALHYEPTTGKLYWKIAQNNRMSIGAEAGTRRDDGYKRIKLDGIAYYSHVLIWTYMTGQVPVNQIDHIDRDSWNDRWENLRDVTASVNQHNKVVRGCWWHKTKLVWETAISTGGIVTYLGSYATEEEAATAYNAAKSNYLATNN
jgi:hypothetical protein